MAEVRYTLRQLQYFMSTAEHGTVSAAALALHVSDSTLSSSLTTLEQALGTKLLVRQQSRGTSLSAAGRALVPVLAPLLRQIEELPRVLHSSSRLYGVVRVGVSAALAPRVIAQLLRAVEQDHPGISIDIRQEGAEALFRMVRAGELDLAFSGSRVPTDFQSVELFDQEIHVLLPADHRFSGRDRVEIQELADEPLVLLDSSPALENSLSMLLAAGIRPIIRYRTPNFELVRSMVAQGLGYSLQAVRPWGDHSYENRPLAVVPLAGNPQTHPVVLLWSAESIPGPATEAVVDLARAVFREGDSPS